MAGGRPTKYTPEFGKLICERIATNPVGYSTLLQLYPDLPNVNTIRCWRNSIEEFSVLYLAAKKQQIELMVEDIDDLIPIGIQYYTDDKGQERIDAPSASLVIAKINNRKWMAARLSPKLYGDKKQSEELSPSDTLSKIQSLVADLNKTNTSEI